MFDMTGGGKKAAVETFEFDLEAELKDPGKLKATKEQVEERIQQLKTMLRQGDDKETFDKTQTLLHGYLALQKVFARVGRKLG